jgi:hypothetical protein
MRKITKLASEAFNLTEVFSLSNTVVSVEDGVVKLFLHGNLIAKKVGGELFVTNAGWKSNTTKERLNGLCGVTVCQKKGEWYLNGNLWGGELVKI